MHSVELSGELQRVRSNGWLCKLFISYFYIFWFLSPLLSGGFCTRGISVANIRAVNALLTHRIFLFFNSLHVTEKVSPAVFASGDLKG